MDLATTVSGALVGSGVTLAIRVGLELARTRYHAKYGEFTGRWYAILTPSGAKGERREVMRVKQHGQVLQISIRRYSPPEEVGRRWKMLAYCHGNILIGVFYTIVPKQDPSSYGAILLHRDRSVTECSVWRGYYVRPNGNSLDQIMRADVERHPLVWQQVKPELRSYGDTLPGQSTPAPS
jgi:hypothetical protein